MRHFHTVEEMNAALNGPASRGMDLGDQFTLGSTLHEVVPNSTGFPARKCITPLRLASEEIGILRARILAAEKRVAALEVKEREAEEFSMAHELLWRRDGDCQLCEGDCDGPTSIPVRTSEEEDVSIYDDVWVHKPTEDDEPGDADVPCGNPRVHEALWEAKRWVARTRKEV